MKTEDWLKDADGIVIECEEDDINPHTLVSVTPTYMEGTKSSGGGQRIMTLQEALKINKKQIAKGDKFIAYLNSWIGKKIFD